MQAFWCPLSSASSQGCPAPGYGHPPGMSEHPPDPAGPPSGHSQQVHQYLDAQGLERYVGTARHSEQANSPCLAPIEGAPLSVIQRAEAQVKVVAAWAALKQMHTIIMRRFPPSYYSWQRSARQQCAETFICVTLCASPTRPLQEQSLSLTGAGACIESAESKGARGGSCRVCCPGGRKRDVAPCRQRCCTGLWPRPVGYCRG